MNEQKGTILITGSQRQDRLPAGQAFGRIV